MDSFLLTRVRFGSLNRCGVLKQRDYLYEFFDNPHLADTLLKISPIWSRHHETPQFYKSSVCEPSLYLHITSSGFQICFFCVGKSQVEAGVAGVAQPGKKIGNCVWTLGVETRLKRLNPLCRVE